MGLGRRFDEKDVGSFKLGDILAEVDAMSDDPWIYATAAEDWQ